MAVGASQVTPVIKNRRAELRDQLFMSNANPDVRRILEIFQLWEEDHITILKHGDGIDLARAQGSAAIIDKFKEWALKPAPETQQPRQRKQFENQY